MVKEISVIVIVVGQLTGHEIKPIRSQTETYEALCLRALKEAGAIEKYTGVFYDHGYPLYASGLIIGDNKFPLQALCIPTPPGFVE